MFNRVFETSLWLEPSAIRPVIYKMVRKHILVASGLVMADLKRIRTHEGLPER